MATSCMGLYRADFILACPKMAKLHSWKPSLDPLQLYIIHPLSRKAVELVPVPSILKGFPAITDSLARLKGQQI